MTNNFVVSTETRGILLKSAANDYGVKKDHKHANRVFDFTTDYNTLQNNSNSSSKNFFLPLN